MAEIFVSYSRIDRDFGSNLHQELINQDLGVWIDWEDIPISSEWWQEIKTGIEESDNFIFIISPNSMTSPICHLELQYARGKNKRIIPILYAEFNEQEVFQKISNTHLNEFTKFLLGQHDIAEIAKLNWQEISRLNWHIFKAESEFNEKVQQLIETVRMDLAWVKTHTRLLMRGLSWDNSNDQSLLLRGNELQEAFTWLEASSKIAGQEPLELHNRFIIASQNYFN